MLVCLASVVSICVCMAERRSWMVRRMSSRSLVWREGGMVESNESTNDRLQLLCLLRKMLTLNILL